MKPEAIDWDEDLPPAEPEEEYRDLVRSIKRTKGFSLLFVECSPAEGERWITRVKTDIPQQKIEVLRLKESVYDFYNLIEELPNRDRINVLFVQGLEYSLYEYEQEKKDIGWESKDIYSYSWRGVPPVLINLNQQRERFRDNFKICFVFLLPKFAIDYFIQRAPDFFDWRSSLFKLSMDKELLQLESRQACWERGNLEDYLALTPQERKRELVRIQTLIDEDGQIPKQKAELFFEQGLLYSYAEEYAKAITCYDKALEIKPDFHEAWNNRGNALGNLGRWEEARSSYDKALKIKPDSYEVWNNRGIALSNLGRLEEAIASFDKALQIKPDSYEAWYNRGLALDNLGRLEEAITCYDKALEIKPDLHEAWNNRGTALGNLGRVEEARSSFDKALEIKPDDDEAWYYRGIALGNLGRLEEAIASFDKALEIKPDDDAACYYRGYALSNLGRWKEAIASYDKALEFKPDSYEAWNSRGYALRNLGRWEEAIASYDKALEFKPDSYEAWNNRGYALRNLGRWEEAIASYDKALEFK
ncbi:tetratricopeptide repeat protein, partial [Microcoleus sp. S36b_A4]|uniref:tetratricopeptide repeat protein n=1 Tax=Microcoleus sp. S36b_A4 TaxID=3055420 RepID=UPI002FD08CA9